MRKFHQDLVFCQAPADNDLSSHVHDHQVEKLNPFCWVESKFGFKPVVYSSFFGGKQEDGLVKAVENFLKRSDDCELAAIDAIAAAAHSLVIAIAVVRDKLPIEEAIELIRLEEDFQRHEVVIRKFDGRMFFALWQGQVKNVLIQFGLHKMRNVWRYCPGGESSAKVPKSLT
ncbi:hypothetical protein PIB30_042489 [Stylosanthes scabra]|uniref:Uncharacterized protein n=1 Tax=Stylosanthes scabra TaxID=79078 RepID=A0ABU6YCK5_9FABA|nr:hypothetical protein [Stylosanthes scabra]